MGGGTAAVKKIKGAEIRQSGKGQSYYYDVFDAKGNRTSTEQIPQEKLPLYRELVNVENARAEGKTPDLQALFAAYGKDIPRMSLYGDGKLRKNPFEKYGVQIINEGGGNYAYYAGDGKTRLGDALNTGDPEKKKHGFLSNLIDSGENLLGSTAMLGLDASGIKPGIQALSGDKPSEILHDIGSDINDHLDFAEPLGIELTKVPGQIGDGISDLLGGGGSGGVQGDQVPESLRQLQKKALGLHDSAIDEYGKAYGPEGDKNLENEARTTGNKDIRGFQGQQDATRRKLQQIVASRGLSNTSQGLGGQLLQDRTSQSQIGSVQSDIKNRINNLATNRNAKGMATASSVIGAQDVPYDFNSQARKPGLLEIASPYIAQGVGAYFGSRPKNPAEDPSGISALYNPNTDLSRSPYMNGTGR